MHFFKNSLKLANFCVAILILKIKENKQCFGHIVLYYFKKGKNATAMQKMICAVYGDGAVTVGTCQKWFAKFLGGDYLLDDASQSGRSGEVYCNQIETLFENNQYSTMWEIADILKISKSINLLVKMKIVSFILSKN